MTEYNLFACCMGVSHWGKLGNCCVEMGEVEILPTLFTLIQLFTHGDVDK